MISLAVEFWSFDLETTGLDRARCVPIDVGLIQAPLVEGGWGDGCSSLVGAWDWEDWLWGEHAATIHGITKADLAGQPGAGTVDRMLADFIRVNTGTDEAVERVLLGWNVGTFDAVFARKFFPQFMGLMSHRVLDINSTLMALDFLGVVPYADSKRFLQPDEPAHRALLDAVAAANAMESLRELLKNPAPWQAFASISRN